MMAASTSASRSMGSLSSLGWFFKGGWLINKGRAGVYLSGFNGYPLVMTNGLPWTNDDP